MSEFSQGLFGHFRKDQIQATSLSQARKELVDSINRFPGVAIGAESLAQHTHNFAKSRLDKKAFLKAGVSIVGGEPATNKSTANGQIAVASSIEIARGLRRDLIGKDIEEVIIHNAFLDWGSAIIAAQWRRQIRGVSEGIGVVSGFNPTRELYDESEDVAREVYIRKLNDTHSLNAVSHRRVLHILNMHIEGVFLTESGIGDLRFGVRRMNGFVRDLFSGSQAFPELSEGVDFEEPFLAEFAATDEVKSLSIRNRRIGQQAPSEEDKLKVLAANNQPVYGQDRVSIRRLHTRAANEERIASMRGDIDEVITGLYTNGAITLVEGGPYKPEFPDVLAEDPGYRYMMMGQKYLPYLAAELGMTDFSRLFIGANNQPLESATFFLDLEEVVKKKGPRTVIRLYDVVEEYYPAIKAI